MLFAGCAGKRRVNLGVVAWKMLIIKARLGKKVGGTVGSEKNSLLGCGFPLCCWDKQEKNSHTGLHARLSFYCPRLGGLKPPPFRWQL